MRIKSGVWYWLAVASGALPLLRPGAAGVGRAARHSCRRVGQMQKSRL